MKINFPFPLFQKVALIFALFLIASCATFDFQADKARDLIRAKDFDKLIEQYKEKSWKESDNQLVYLFDYGMAQHLAKNYQESNKAFLLADELSEVKDYHSISRITGSLLLNEGMVQYKGDDYEKIMVNGVLALNFLMLDKLDSALVETRKLNRKLYNYKFEAKRNYEQSPLAYYLAGMIWEADGRWDDAYIDYKHAFELAPNFSFLKEDLIRLSTLSKRNDELKKWKKQFSDVAFNPKWKDPSYGELILIFQQGWGPRKKPNPDAPRFPKMYPIPTSTKFAELQVVGEQTNIKTSMIYSVQDVAIKTMTDQYAALVAKRIAGIATKAVVADQIRQKDSALGDLAWIGMNLLDRADTRQWSTLPETFQVARVWLKKGVHKIQVQGLSSSGSPTGESLEAFDIEIIGGKKKFITWRSVR